MYLSTNILLCPGSPAAAGSGGVVQSPALPQFDQAWVEQRAKKAALKLEKLDTDLKNYKSNSIKESIRRGYDDLGDHYLDCGDLQNALKAYSRSRDYCTSGKHVVNMCLNVIKVSVQLQNWSHVISYVNKAMATPDFAATEPGGGGGGAGVNAAANANKSSDANVLLTRLRCASGLAELATRKYKNAAKHFLAANVDHCDIPDMMSTQVRKETIFASTTFWLKPISFCRTLPRTADSARCRLSTARSCRRWSYPPPASSSSWSWTRNSER